ncbi:MAG: hypothetical protein QM729_09425 [Solirubrobacterales bacterium]
MLARIVVCIFAALLVAAAPAGATKPGARRAKVLGTLAKGAHPSRLAIGSDRTVWYSGVHTVYYGGEWSQDNEGSFIGHLSPGGTPTETTLEPGTFAGQPVVVPGGDVWYPESHENAQGDTAFEVVGYSAAGRTQRYAVGSGVTDIDTMVTMDGNLWFSGWATVEGAERGVIGRIELGAGALALFPLEPGCGAGEALAATADTIWFGESCPMTSSSSSRPLEGSNLGKIDSSGTITRLALPAGDRPIAVAAASDASVWVGMRNDNYRRPSPLVHLDASGKLVGRRVWGASFHGMTVGREGRLWFSSIVQPTVYDGIASIGPAGHKSRPICVSGKRYCAGGISELTTGPEGTLWYAAGPAASHGIGGGGGSGLMEEENLERAAGFIGRVR